MTRTNHGLFAVAAAAAMFLLSSGVLAGAAGQSQPAQTMHPPGPDRPQAALTPVQIPPMAQQYLASAIDALNGVDTSALRGETASGVVAVRQDFERMRAALTNPGANGDWRTAYSAVERDLSTLLQPAGGQPGASPGAPQGSPMALDTVTRGSLELFRTNLALFQQSMPAAPANPGAPAAGTPTQSGAQNPPAQTTSSLNASGAGALLDRIDAIVSAALGNKPTPPPDTAVGTAGKVPSVDKKSSSGKVTIDRAALDEILAEVRQLKVMLRVHE